MSTTAQTSKYLLLYPARMKIKELTRRQLSSVSCPTCGVAAGESCVLHSGGPRSEPHVDRKLSAAEAVKTKRIPRGAGQSINPLPTNNPEYAGRKPRYQQ